MWRRPTGCKVSGLQGCCPLCAAAAGTVAAAAATRSALLGLLQQAARAAGPQQLPAAPAALLGAVPAAPSLAHGSAACCSWAVRKGMSAWAGPRSALLGCSMGHHPAVTCMREWRWALPPSWAQRWCGRSGRPAPGWHAMPPACCHAPAEPLWFPSPAGPSPTSRTVERHVALARQACVPLVLLRFPA